MRSIETRLAAWACRLEWALLLLAAPFLLFPTAQRSLALLAVPAIWLAAWLATGRPLPNTPLNLPILLVMVMVLVSEYATYDIAYSLPKIAGVVLGVGLYFAFVTAGRVEKGLRTVLLIFLAGGLGVAGLGLLGTHFVTKFAFLQPLLQRLPFLIQGLPGADSGFHPNEVAGGLLWVLPLMMVGMVWALLNLRDWARRMGWGWTIFGGLGLMLTTGFSAGVLFLTQSRSGIIGLAGGLILLPTLFFRPKGRWIYLACLALLTAGLGLAAWRLGWVQNLYADTTSGNDPAYTLNTLDGRLEVWRRGIYGIQDFPITGMGMNTFRKVVNVLYPLYKITPNTDVGHAHNEFLQAALDLGLPGLVGFIALYLAALWMLGQTWHSVEGGRDSSTATEPGPPRSSGRAGLNGLLDSPAGVKALVLGLGGGLLAHAIYGLTDAVTLGAKPGILFWMLLGLISGLYLGREQRDNAHARGEASHANQSISA